MQLMNTDGRLDAILRGLEKRTRSVLVLDSFQKEVVVLEDFSAEAIDANRRTPAGFRASTNRIEVNGSTYFDLAVDEQEAVMMHEVAHAALRDQGHHAWKSDIQADLSAADWGGVRAQLVKSRRRDWGDEYADALAMAPATGNAAAATLMEGVWTRRMAGTM